MKRAFSTLLKRWGAWWDSNPRHPEPQSGVPPLNYRHHLVRIGLEIASASASGSLLAGKRFRWKLARQFIDYSNLALAMSGGKGRLQ